MTEISVTSESLSGLFGEMDYNHQHTLWASLQNALCVKHKLL